VIKKLLIICGSVCGYALVKPVVEGAGRDGKRIIDSLEMFHRLMGSEVKVMEYDEEK
jgi:hypothetical protein